MKIALISTVYNESATIGKWIAAVRSQTVTPDEFVVVDGGSKDNTVQMLEEGFKGSDFPAPRVIVQRCNIAEGRNLAIRNTTAPVIASVDAGAVPDSHWLEEITRPYREHPEVMATGGYCPLVEPTTDFLKTVHRYMHNVNFPEGSDHPTSSRNIGFRRSAWEAVGGYPEWLTLTAEDFLFNTNLHYVGIPFYHCPRAIVSWELRSDAKGFYKLMRTYAFGSAEAGLGGRMYLSYLATTLLPPLILLSRHPLRDAPFRYARNAAAAWGWVKGKLFGNKPPAGWKYLDHAWISPEALAYVKKQGRPI